MKIPLPVKEIRQSIPAKDFNELYITNLSIQAQQKGPGDRIILSYCPYDADSGESLDASQKTLVLPLWESVETVPEVASAFVAIATAVAKLVALEAAKSTAI